jgi:hypothetical protein
MNRKVYYIQAVQKAQYFHAKKIAGGAKPGNLMRDPDKNLYRGQK